MFNHLTSIDFWTFLASSGGLLCTICFALAWKWHTPAPHEPVGTPPQPKPLSDDPVWATLQRLGRLFNQGAAQSMRGSIVVNSIVLVLFALWPNEKTTGYIAAVALTATNIGISFVILFLVTTLQALADSFETRLRALEAEARNADGKHYERSDAPAERVATPAMAISPRER